MDEKRAREILGVAIRPDNSISCVGHYMAWKPGDADIALDSTFEIEELEAILWWMQNHPK